MLTSPVGGQRNTTSTRLLQNYALGLMIGASLSATGVLVLSGLASGIPAPVGYAAVAAAAIVAVGRDTGLVSFPIPQNARLVPKDIFDRHGWLAASLIFGVEMGSGVRTYVTSSVPYVLVISLVFLGPGVALTYLAALGFAFGRLPIMLGRSRSRDQAVWDRNIARQVVLTTRIAVLATPPLAIALVL